MVEGRDNRRAEFKPLWRYEDVDLWPIVQLPEEFGLQLYLLVNTVYRGEGGSLLALLAGLLEDVQARGVYGFELLDDVQGFAHVLGLLGSGHAGGQMIPGVPTHRRFRNVV